MNDEAINWGSLGGAGRVSDSKEQVAWAAVSGLWPPEEQGFGEAIRQLALQLEQLRGTSQQQVEALVRNTQAVVENTIAQASGSKGSTLSAVGRVVSRVFTSGLGLSPVISALSGLFGGGEKKADLPLVRTERGPELRFVGSVAGGRTWWTVEEARTGLPLSWSAGLAADVLAGRVTDGGSAPGGGFPWREDGETDLRRVGISDGRPTVHVTVQVQAIDSRSFMDHSEEIARAVREAMLHSHALNDVVVDL